MGKENDFRTQYGYILSDRNREGLTAPMEDYIETIYRLSTNAIRVNNLAAHLRISPAAVSRMAESLKHRGLVESKRYGFISLTEEGKRTGAFLLWRHETVKKLLERINGEEAMLSENKQIEHCLSLSTVKNIEAFLEHEKNDIPTST